MTVSRLRRWSLPLLVLLATARCGGGDSLTLPDDGLPAAIVQVAGDGQTGVVGQRLTDTLVVQVTDAKARKVQAQKIVFRAVAGGTGATLIPDTTLTDVNGLARSVWVLGSLVGAQRVEARVIASGTPGTLKTAFTATAVADQPDTVFALAGNNQSGAAGSVLPAPLTVVVTDRFGNPIAGVTVSWTVPSGQGSVSAGTTVTAADGQASVTRTLGTGSGPQSASAVVTGVGGSPVVFTHTALAGGATRLVKIRGDNRVAPAGFQDSVVVRLEDANGNGVPNGSITWAPAQNGSVAPALSQTDANGYAFTFWTLGPVAGPQNLTATAAPSGFQVVFAATATASVPTTVARASGNPASYIATAGQSVTTPPSVKVTDQNGNPVQGVNVDFVVTGGGGQVSNGVVTAGTVTILTTAGGIATLSAWTLGPIAGANSLEARAVGASNAPLAGSPISWTATGQAGTAAQLAVTVQPSAAAQSGVVLATQPSVQLKDQFGNNVSQSGVVVTAAVAGGGATLGGTVTATTNGTGTASFTGLTLSGTVGSYGLTLSAGSLTPATTQSIVLSAGPAAVLAITTQPSASATSGVALPQQPVVQLRDASGNNVAQASVTVTVALTSGGGSLSGTLTATTNAAGAASFTGLTITGAAGARTLSFSATGLTSATSTAVTLGAGTATALAITTQPSTTALSGSLLAQQPAVQLKDASGNDVAQAGVTITATPSGATLGGTTSIVTNGNGTATFTDLSLTGAAGSYTITFAASGLTGATSTAIQLQAGSATKVVLVTQPPATAQSTVALSPAPAVQLQDATGNNVPQQNLALTASISSGPGGSLGGTTTVQTSATGSATFGNLLINGPVGSYTLTFSGTGLTAALSTTITVSAGPAAALVLTTAPDAAPQNGVAFATQPQVQLIDGAGNPVALGGTTITATVLSGPAGSTLTSATTVTSAGGLASFSGLTLTGTVGSYTLQFAASGLTSVASGAVALSPGAPTGILKTLGDNQTGTVGSTLPVNPTVLVTDASGNPVPGSTVTFAVTNLLGGTVGSPTAITDAAGLASTTWTLRALLGLNTVSATSSAGTVNFTATGAPGLAGQLSITTQPSATAASGVGFAQQPVIQLQDQLGNPVLTGGVAISTTASAGTLQGTTTVVTNSQGVATFTNLSLTGTVGSYTLTFSGNGLSGVTSNAIALAAGTPARLVVVTQPSTPTPSGAPFVQQPQVQVQDAAGNPVANSGRQVTAAINTGPGGTLGAVGRTVTTDAAGLASFVSLTLTGPVGSYTLLFSSAGLAADTSATLDISAGGASQMTAASSTSQTATVSTTVAAPPTVLVRDVQNNPVAGIAVTFQVTAGGGALNGASAVTDALGQAAVTSWTLGATAGSNTVTATANGLPTVTFTATGTAGSATTIALNGGNNQSGTVGTAVGTAPSAKVTDANGNGVSGVSVTFAVTGGGGSVTGGSASSNSQGIATVGSWTLGTTAGTNSLTATSGTLGGSPVTFTAIGTAGLAATIASNAGNGQSATVGTAVSIAPSVLITDGFGNPKSGVTVTFLVTGGGGSLTGGTASSNASGIATVGSWTLGGTAGSNTLSASASGLSGSPVVFSAIGITGGATTIALNAGNGQSAIAGSSVAIPPSVKVTDAGGNPVGGVGVTFAVTSGGGSILPVGSVTTDGAGLATATSWTLGTTAGVNTLAATATGLSGSPVTFTATGTAGSATQLAVTTQPPATAQNGVAFSVQPVVQLRDVHGNNVSQAGVSVSAAIASGGGTLGGTTTVSTNASGQAVYSALSITGAVGAHTVRFTSGVLAPATSGTVTTTAGSATTLAIDAGNNQSAGVGTAVAIPPSVLITDVSGNPVTGTTVTFAVTSGGGSITGGSTTSNTSGIATVGSWTLGGAAGSNTLSATSVSLSGSPATFTATGTTGSATKLAVTTAAPTTAQNGIAFPTQPVVQLQDAGGNSVAQAGVTVTAVLFAGTRTLSNATVVTDPAGQAVFTGLAINGLTGLDSLNFTSGALTATARAPLTVTAGTAVKLGVNRQPATTGQSGVALTTQPRAQVQDVSGNSVSVTGVVVTATIASGPVGATLTNPTATTGATGLATFAGLAISGSPGTYTLLLDATAAGYTAVVSGNIVLSVGPASQLTITTQPLASVASGTAFSPPPVVQLRDAFGNAVPSQGIAVTASIASGTGGTLSNATASTDVAGAATFTGLTLSGTAGTFALQFSGTGLTPVTSATVTLTAGGGSKLAVTTQPSSSVANGTVFPQQPVIQLQDGAGNPVSQAGVAVTAGIQSGSGTLGGTVSATTNASGQASFTNLQITGTAGNFVLQFGAGSFAGVSSSAITVTAGTPTSIALNAGSGQSTTVNTAVATLPSVVVRDVSSNVVNGVSVTFAVTGGGGSLTGGSATTNSSGIATVGSWTLGQTAGTNTLTAASTGLSGSPVSFTATGTADAASQLVMVTQPSSTAQSAVVFAQQPAVRLADQFGNTVATTGTSVTAAIASGSGTLGGTATVNTVSGVASFAGLSITGTAGGHTLGFTSGSLTAATSSTITLGAGAATTIALSTGDGQSATVNTAVATNPAVLVTDGSGNPVSGVSVTFAVASGGGSVTGSAGTTNASGIATVGSWTLGTTAGANSLTASSGTLSGSPVTFTATGLAGSATQLVMVTQPSSGAQSGIAFGQQPSVRLEDQFGNSVSTTGTPVTVAIGSGGGTLGGTATVTTVSGVATFAGLSITGVVGAHTLSFTSGSLTAATSTTITLGAGAATAIALSAGDGQSATVNTAVATNPAVLVTDGAGNPVSGVSVTFAVTGGGGSLTGGSATTGSNGIATLGSWTLGTTAGGNTLTAMSTGLSGSPVSFTATGTAGSADHLAFTVQPSMTQNGQIITPAVEVSVLDQFDNLVTGATDLITLTIAVDGSGGGATLSGTNPVSAVAGVATFSDLSIDQTGNGFQLGANAAGLTSALSASFHIN